MEGRRQGDKGIKRGVEDGRRREIKGEKKYGEEMEEEGRGVRMVEGRREGDKGREVWGINGGGNGNGELRNGGWEKDDTRREEICRRNGRRKN